MRPKELTGPAIREAYEEGSRAMRREQHDYNINRSFLNGEQWVFFDRVRNTITTLPRDPSRTRITMNRLWPAARTLMAQIMSRPLAFEVPPSSTDDVAVKGANIAEAVIEDLHREHNWEDLREQVAWSTLLGGTTILSVDWNTRDAGPTIGHTNLTGKPFGRGEIQESVLTVLEATWEPGVRDAERGLWWVRAQALPPSEVQTIYELDEEPEADASPFTPPLSSALVRENRSEMPVNLTLVLSYYERPNPDRPNGAVATVVNNRLVDGPHDWPFPFKDRLNLVVMRETKVVGRATGDTIFSAAVPVQAAYNASWSNIIEHMKLAGNARLLVPDAAIDGVDELTDLPAEIVTYNAAGGVPNFLSPPSMPQWWIDQPVLLAQQMDDILGIHDVSRGVAPKNIESGTGLSILVEQDQTPLGRLATEIGMGFEKMARMALQIYEKKVKETRKARVRLAGFVPEEIDWTGKALAGQTVPKVPKDQIIPRSRAAMAAFAERMLQMGIIQDPIVFAQLAEMPNQESMIERIDPDAAKAIRENHWMGIGKVPIPESFDDHRKHIKAHNEFRKSRRYESLSKEMKEQIGDHIQGHETLAAEEAGRLTALAQQGGPALANIPTAQGSEPLPPNIPTDQLGPAQPGAGAPTPQLPEELPPPAPEGPPVGF